MKLIKELSFNDKIKLINKKVHFKSNCELFLNFDVKVEVLSYYIAPNNEFIYNNKDIKTRKNLKIGTNMKELQYELI